MPEYQVGEPVVHWTFGSGKVTAVADKGEPGQPCFYYVIEGEAQTLWVPVEEAGGSSLHRPASRSEFNAALALLRTTGEKVSDNPFKRRDQLDERMRKATTRDLCRVIRDLSYRSRSRKLTSSDVRTFKLAQSFLLEEWQRSLGTPRAAASRELKGILRKKTGPG